MRLIRAGQLLRSNRRLFATKTTQHNENLRVNYANIQMLSPGLYRQLFRNVKPVNPDEDTQCRVRQHLQEHDLWGQPSSVGRNVDFKLPPLNGSTLDDHFRNISNAHTKEYLYFAEQMASTMNRTPPIPTKWQFLPGWTKYFDNGSFEKVNVPDADALVFDVEVCVNAGDRPVIATALSKEHWYCWVGGSLFTDVSNTPITPYSMIPLEDCTQTKKLVIGHHVCFDRSYVRDQYSLKCSKTRYLDTLSLHVCVSGVTNEQRNYLQSKAEGKQHYDWMDVGAMNSLAVVYQHYCGKPLDKAIRDLFVHGSLEDIKQNFQDCVKYCANDVKCTHEVFQTIWPMFRTHAPHPVTLAGMLEMSTAYLPIDSSWNTYVSEAEALYARVSGEMRGSLMRVADDALNLIVGDSYKEDPWLWNLDWAIHKSVVDKDKLSLGESEKKDKLVEKENEKPACDLKEENDNSYDDVHAYIEHTLRHLTEKRRQQLHLAGYPNWYRKLCKRPGDEDYRAGPCNISSQTRATPSLLRMTWDGYPLHHEIEHGWGFLVPNRGTVSSVKIDETKAAFPIKQYLEVIKEREKKRAKNIENEEAFEDGIDIGIPGILFHKLPHKDGPQYNVGNPLAKDFLSKIEDGTLTTADEGFNAKEPILQNILLSFWRNGRKRIMTQKTVWLNDGTDCGVILPQLISAGTVTRRAVEPTWLTASNPVHNRIGSELKCMVRAPPDHCLVGADVDSQELWIASVLGDALFSRIHGSTALSWMTLQGKKSERTDLHSKTADTIGMSRGQAKIFNYGRIYGAGERFAVRLLMQFNHQLSSAQAKEKATKLYQTTKGVKSYYLTSEGLRLARAFGVSVTLHHTVTYANLKKLLTSTRTSWNDRGLLVSKTWMGGTESEMFNKLESIAVSSEPRTPVLDCMITKALLPKYVQNNYMTSRVNWVVQSSAVDYLHLMLANMRWLIDHYKIQARFCISIHDEVRYIVHEDDKYRAALALQISNLLTRAMFAHKLQLNDLPQSVAFFSSVEIDKVLRKEVDMDCATPSNPLGLSEGHGIFPGEALDIHELLEKINGGDLHLQSDSLNTKSVG